MYLKKVARKINGYRKKIQGIFLSTRLGYSYLKHKNGLYFWLCAYFPSAVILYRKVIGISEKTIMNKTLVSYTKKNADFFVLQLGANDGYDNDPIHDLVKIYNWSGILIEPQPYVYDNFLKKTYKSHNNLKLLNCAIAPSSGRETLYKIAFSNARWATGLTSFSIDGINNLIKSGYIQERAKRQKVKLPESEEEYIEKLEIQTLSFNTLIKEYEIHTIDLLQIDVEGFDYELLKLFPFEVLKPTFINFEYTHLNAQDSEECLSMLKLHNYELHKGSTDYFCVLKN